MVGVTGYAVKREWLRFRGAAPGRRFIERYNRKRSRGRGATLGSVLMIAAGMVVILVGVVFAFIPGPAVLFYFVGGGLLAGEIRFAAKGMDWLELRSRRWWRKIHSWGKHVFRRNRESG